MKPNIDTKISSVRQPDRQPDIRSFTKGDLLFVEGQPPEGAFVLREGRVKLSICSRSGRVTILRIAEPGDLIGLAPVMASAECDSTAEALEDCRADVIRRGALLASLERDPKAAREMVLELSRRCLTERQLIASLANSDPVFVRLARLFLSWTENGHRGRLRLTNSFTHQQIAEMIGTSRETVTRAVKEMRERDLVTLKGEDLLIHDRDRLQLVTGLREPL